jgi:imidazolonepropionase-like amidohydrolase
VTTVRDLGDRDALTVALRASIDSGAKVGPRIIAATTPLTSPGGHCGFLGGEVSTDNDIRAQITRNAAAGADLIKVMASGGALTPGGPRMWEAQFTPGDQMGPERAKAMVEVILDMREAGVRFIAGTDAGVPEAHFGDYVGMLEFFASLGFAHPEILDMATVNAAQALGLSGTGVLAPGKRADLIVIDGNPLTELGALRRIQQVFTAGRPVARPGVPGRPRLSA